MYTMKTFLSILIILFLNQVYAENFVQLSTQLIQKTRDKENVTLILKQLKESHLEELIKDLDTDNKKKTFWINVYNSYIIFYLRDNPELYQDRSRFFHEKKINIAGELMSFDDIEHGFIRGSKLKLSLGLIKNPFASKIERKLRVDKVDPRIHFALNCGAKSCPPVPLLEIKQYNEQMDAATKNYLQQNTKIEANKIYTTVLFSWFRGDFDGLDGVKKFLVQYNIIKEEDTSKGLEFNEYDWTIDIDNFTDI